MDDLEILQTIQELDDFDKYCEANPIMNKPPSTFSLMMAGASNNMALQFLYSTGLDHMVDKFMDLISQGGSIDEILASDTMFASMMQKMGFDSSTMFKGQVSQSLIASINKVTESNKYKKTKTKLFKIIKIFNGLNNGAKHITDPEVKQKYLEAANSVKQIIKFVGKIYKNRRLVNERVQRGLSIALNESLVDDVCILESFI